MMTVYARDHFEDETLPGEKVATVNSGALSPAAFDYFLREWLGFGYDMNASPSHYEITRLFTQHCWLPANHPGVRQEQMVSKANRLRSAYDAATEQQKHCLLEGLFQLAPVDSESWRTADLESRILGQTTSGKPAPVVDNRDTRNPRPSRNAGGRGDRNARPKAPTSWGLREGTRWSPSEQSSPKTGLGPFANPSTPQESLQPDPGSSEPATTVTSRDFFLSHAGENKDFGRLLVNELGRQGATVWFDEFEIMIGDRISDAISEGLAQSRLGITLLSPEYIVKKWPMEELNTLLSLEGTGATRILPVLHNLSHDDLVVALPILANRRYIDSGTSPLSEVVSQLMSRLQRDKDRAQQ